MQQGRGERFRQPTLFERMAVGVGARLPQVLRTPASRAYARFVSRLQQGRLVAELPHGEHIHLLARHRYLSWNREEYEAFRAEIRPGDTVLDVGANLGAYTVLFARWTGPSGRVFAFEPAPVPRQALQEMLDVNGVARCVTVLDTAVSSRHGTALFHAEAASGANRLIREQGPDAIVVNTITIDQFCEQSGVTPRLIKIDVEGAELHVLRGARQTIASTPDLRLYVEIHPRLWPELGLTPADLERELTGQGLRAERLDRNPDTWNIEGVCLRLVRCAS